MLKSCPFCGANATAYKNQVSCSNEHCSVDTVFIKADTAENAAIAWNKRTPAAPVQSGESYRARSARLSAGRITWQERAAIELMYAAPAPAAQADGRELDLYDEIECDLPALFGRASIEGHETGQNLAMQLQAKMRKARQQLTVTSGNAVLHISDDGEIGDSVESIVACLGDDAATIREEYPEIAANMGQAAEVLESLAQQSATPADATSGADKRDLYERAYRHGWINCSKWAERVDLVSDVDSPAYEKERDEAYAVLVQRERQQGAQSNG